MTREGMREELVKIIASWSGFYSLPEAEADLAGFYEDVDEILSYLHSEGGLDTTKMLPLDYSKSHWGLKW